MGARTEKLLVEDVGEVGYTGLRVDFMSGGGFHVPHDAGDIIIGKAEDAFPNTLSPGSKSARTYSDLYVVEEKYKSTDANKYLQEDGEKFEAMIEFAHAIGAKPVLAVRWSKNLDWSPGSFHLLRRAEEVRRTDAGNVSVKPETATEKYETIEEFFTSSSR